MKWSLVASALVTSLLVGTGACRREERPLARPAPSASASAAAAAAAAEQPWTATDSVPNPEGAYRAFVAWHEALERRDFAKLEQLYDDQVEISQITYTKGGALEKKRALSAKYPTYRQELIGKVELSKTPEGRVRASFTMKFGTPGDWEVMAASLDLAAAPNGSDYLVAGESDAKSVRELELRPGCEASIGEALHATPAYLRVEAEIQRSADESSGHASVGGLPPSPDGEGGFVFVIGHFLPERFSTLLTYRVDRHGHVTADGDIEKKIPPDKLSAVETACRR